MVLLHPFVGGVLLAQMHQNKPFVHFHLFAREFAAAKSQFDDFVHFFFRCGLVHDYIQCVVAAYATDGMEIVDSVRKRLAK